MHSQLFCHLNASDLKFLLGLCYLHVHFARLVWMENPFSVYFDILMTSFVGSFVILNFFRPNSKPIELIWFDGEKRHS